MNVSNAASASAATSVGALVNSPQQPAPKSDKPSQEQQDSTVVKLSKQAQQLHRAESQNNPQQAETKTKEAAKAPGIQFMEGDSKRGRVSTYA